MAPGGLGEDDESGHLLEFVLGLTGKPGAEAPIEPRILEKE